jgi:hypothetical protein
MRAHPPRDGRAAAADAPAVSSTVPSRRDRALVRSFRQLLDRHGGFTIDGRTLRAIDRGVSVGADPGSGLMMPRTAWDDEAVASWVHRHSQRRVRDGLHLGGWIDAVRDDVWLDLVRVYPEHDRREALLTGLRHRQHAVFDLGARTMVGLAGLTVASVDSVVGTPTFGVPG